MFTPCTGNGVVVSKEAEVGVAKVAEVPSEAVEVEEVVKMQDPLQSTTSLGVSLGVRLKPIHVIRAHVIQMDLLSVCALSTGFMENPLIGAKSQVPARGETIGSRKPTINEILTSSAKNKILTKYIDCCMVTFSKT